MRFVPLFVVLCAISGSSWAQPDLLGAHGNFSRGCSACHVDRSPTVRNVDGTAVKQDMLWGEDVTSTYMVQSDSFRVSAETTHSETRGLLLCLTCHGGNYAPHAMMKNTHYEKLPVTWATNSPPTFSDVHGADFDRRFADHPMGNQAQLSCDGEEHWDCGMINGKFSMAGPRSSRFAAHYGFFLKPAGDGSKPVVVCTTCHNPHSMNMTEVPPSAASAVYPTGFYPTKYYLRAPYGDRSTGNSNVSAQFCRQCHAELSNEMNGSTAGTIL